MPQGPGFLVTFLYYFSLTTLIGVLVSSQGLGMKLDTAIPYQIGTLLGLVSGLVGAIFNRSATFSIPVADQKVFTQILDRALSELGFEKKTQLEEFTVYEKSAFKTLFSGKVLVKIDQDSATISSRSSNISSLKKMISIDNK